MIFRRAKGFTMIETLVALGIAGIVLNGFYLALSTGSLLDRRASEQADKVLVALNVMDRVGVDIPLRSGTVQNGERDGMEWELVIGSTPPRDMQLGPIFQNELLFVSVTVDGKLEGASPVVLRAIRYAQAPL